ncbi:ubiquitin carboxyl-terminal hydrolase 10 [Polypterus senegalus]|uniref:ubiquitin carboxyl-terminal hydrolase 10 n=1 Tax=Polypterus senegalus TaxID=55291 RepID=UPI00196433B7|nr:ubiquitin carboxyl-terminal hydrolase 10 [Polypterus senegalus]
MASHSNQYIFGEFSADEFNQFFVSPRCFVELPPFNDKIPCVSHSSVLTGEEYQSTECGADEACEPEADGLKDCKHKVSSTLNPQAPEFILSCHPSHKVNSLQASNTNEFNSVDCQHSEASSMDDNRAEQGLDMDSTLGSLGQRERKKKKKRPPGYYNYLEGSSSNGSSSSNSAQAHSETQILVGLVNGHAVNSLSPGSHGSDEAVLEASGMVPEDFTGNGACVSSTALITTATIMSTTSVSSASNQRTCESPDNTNLNLGSRAISLTYMNNASSSSSSSNSSEVTDASRTADQKLDPFVQDSTELIVNEIDGSSTPLSVPCLPQQVSCIDPSHSAANCVTATNNPTISGDSDKVYSTTDEEEIEKNNVLNGQLCPQSDNCAEIQLDPLGTNEDQQQQEGFPEPCEIETKSSEDLGLSSAPLSTSMFASAVSNPPAKSWASLFHNSKPSPGGPVAFVEMKSMPVVTATIPAATQTHDRTGEVKESPVPVSEDPMAFKIAGVIENVKLIHKPVSLQPRGLINKGNWCYINATLQALIACPPMYHLMKSIPVFTETERPCTSTPMLDSFVRLVNEFSNMPVPSKAKQQAGGDKVVKDIRPGSAFEPTYIYKLLTVIKSSLSEKGRQEDAEEYLGFILNGLHEEMLALKRLVLPKEDNGFVLNGPEPSQVGVEEEMLEEGGSDDEWEQVGPRNKSSITRQADFIRTPITDIFGGHIRSVVYQQSSKESATLQPFFSLQLDIQSEKIRTVQDALESLVARESVQGYTTKSKQEIEISRRVTLEELPPVLVLHLKRFVYEKSGGCQKLIKNIEYPVDLEISKELLSPGVRSKIFKGQRTYRLFAVVYHHGNSATGGHYTTDVFHIGLNGWLRIDDQLVKVIGQHQVVKQTAERTVYLLYYRRVDLL